TVPADAQHSTSPLRSVIVTIVLLNVAFTWAIPRATLRRVFRLPDAFLATMQLLHTLLAGHGLARALSRPGVRPRPLPPYGQPATVPHAPETADVTQPRDVRIDDPTELTFHLV